MIVIFVKKPHPMKSFFFAFLAVLFLSSCVAVRFPEEIEIKIDNNLLGLWEPTRLELYQQTTDIGSIRIEGDTISSLNSNEDLELVAPGTGSVRANDSFVIGNRPSVQDSAIDPLYDANGVKLYAKTPSGGDTGLYFVNTNDTRGEVISKNRALLFGLIF